jgi:hypothetical protein
VGSMDTLTPYDIWSNLNLKYHKVAGGKSYLHAVYQPTNTEYSHPLVIFLGEDFSRLIEQRIDELLVSAQVYAREHPEDLKPAEIVAGSPRKVSKQPDEGTVVVKAKTPRELEKEAEDEIDRQALEN